jgi:protein-S-isoprenylcysteine O-methyltransferase Ste14
MRISHTKTIILAAMPAFVLASTFWSQIRPPLTLHREIGLSLAVVGLVGLVVARFQLNKSFSVRAKATELVTLGIYSKIRNPVYIFGTTFTAGLILWIGKPTWLLALCFLIPMQVMRARKEAEVLEHKFGDAYRLYRAQTWF